MVKIEQGNLLEAPAEALVNTVNTKGVMGKGIALQFKQAYPQMYREYERACNANEVRLGRMHVFDLGGLIEGHRWIINFPTKGHWRTPSRLEDVEAGLKDLREVIIRLGIKSIAVPPLGCGNGGLAWSDVRPLIERELTELPGVDVLVFSPDGAPKAAEMPNRTGKPKLTVGQAIVIALTERYLRGLLAPFVTLLELHKLLYFTQAMGLNLKLRYEANRYGPFARNLRQLLIRMDSHYLSGYGDGEDSPDKPLELVNEAADAARLFLLDKHDVLDAMDRVERLMDGYEDPFSLELLSSVHWVMQNSPRASEDPQAAIDEVHAWNPRKRKLFKPEHIEKAWHRIRSRAWEKPVDDPEAFRLKKANAYSRSR